jgi:hypothetical protein
MAMKVAMTTNASTKTADGAKAAIAAPQATPITAGTVHTPITPGITNPLARWVR